MCTDCNEITIPTGPTGATGEAGPQGDPGVDGTNGTNGTNGTTILATYNSVTGVGTPADLTETILFTYNMPANTLNANGDELELFAHYAYFNNDPVTLRIKLGSKIHTLTVADAENDYRILRIKISRISSTSQLWVIEEKFTTSSEGNIVGIVKVDSSTVNLATILAFEITAENTALGAGQLMLKKATLYKLAV